MTRTELVDAQSPLPVISLSWFYVFCLESTSISTALDGDCSSNYSLENGHINGDITSDPVIHHTSIVVASCHFGGFVLSQSA